MLKAALPGCSCVGGGPESEAPPPDGLRTGVSERDESLLSGIERVERAGEDAGLRGARGGGREGLGGLGGRDPLDDPEGESMPFTRPFGADGGSGASVTDGEESRLL